MSKFAASKRHQAWRSLVVAWVVGVIACAGELARAATIEFLSGARSECTILSKDEKLLHVEITLGGRMIKRSYPLSSIHAVTINDKRYVINEKSGGGTEPASSGTTRSTPMSSSTPNASTPNYAAAGDGNRKSKAEVEALINQLGRTPPDWFDSTQLNYPQTLDLSWPEPAPGGWNNQKNVGQFVWDVINPNPNRWREGVKLMHHLLTIHKDNPSTRNRIMMSLGRMYHDLHEDYARAAFWWKAAGVDQTGSTHYGAMVHLAECYVKLGNKQMAIDLVNKMPATVHGIKFWADLGDMTRALQLADAFVKQNAPGVDAALMHVADGYRQAGQFSQALANYQRVLTLQAQGNQQQRLQKTQARAQASIDAIKLFDLADPARVRDGSYTSSSLGYEGPVQVTVTVASGRIEDVRVTQHREKQFYSALTDTPAKIIAKQGVRGVDATSSATITSEAIINATAKALASGAQ